MTLKWTDTTSYSQSDHADLKADDKADKKATKGPSVFSAQVGHYLRVVVVKNHLYFPGEWSMRLHPIDLEISLDLPSVATPEAAQERAEYVVRGVIRDMALVIR